MNLKNSPQTTTLERHTKNKTLILGASTKPARYSNIAAHRLLEAGEDIVLVAKREGTVAGYVINATPVISEEIDTVTMYLNPEHQKEYYDYIVSLKPRRVIFNPGSENEDFYTVLEKNHIQPIEACTLVMLSIGQY